jgi:uncharacterized membrane protein
MTTAAQEKIETYLGTLRTRLRGLGNEEVNDIVEELRSHILEKSTVNGELAAREVDAVTEALGNPQELASEYITHAALARAEVSRRFNSWQVYFGGRVSAWRASLYCSVR